MFLPSTITLKFGDSGDFVSELQRRLVAIDFLNSAQINGAYDGNTMNAVRSFQARHGIQVDGVAGPDTLRRLNGVISGDTSSGSAPQDAPKEEAPPAAPGSSFVWGSQPAAPQPVSPAPQERPAFAYTPEPAPVESPSAPTQNFQSAPPAPPQPPTNDMAMFAPAQPPQPQHAAPQPTTRPPIPPAPPPQPPAAPNVNARPAEMAAATGNAASPAAREENVPAQRGGLLGRAAQFANAMIQKLADYFETKLPPSVLKEVQDIGVHMARSGVREQPIPTAPVPERTTEMPGRTQEPNKAR